MLTVLGFILTIALLVVVHEYGHYRAAVACGVRVLRFSVGFGRVVWRRRFGVDRCEFAVCALPLGGYVRMLDDREGPVDAREAHRAFNRQPLARRVFIVSAGPAANLLLAVLLFAAVRWMGVEEPKAVLAEPPAKSVAEKAGLRGGDWIQAWSSDEGQWQDLRSMPEFRWVLLKSTLEAEPVRLLVSDRDGRGRRTVELPRGLLQPDDMEPAAFRRSGLGSVFSEPVLGDIRAGGPAATAGLRSGDRVRRVDAAVISDAGALRERIRASAAREMVWEIDRAGQTITLTVRPREVSEPDGSKTGRIEAVVGRPPQMVRVADGPWQGLAWAAQRTWDLSSLTVKTLYRMVIGEASLRNLSGPLTIADAAGQSASRGLVPFLAFLALVSVSLGVLNLLPLPMLDGGHLMYYFYEGVVGRPIPDVWLERLQRGGIAVLLLMMSVALYNDVARLIGLH